MTESTRHRLTILLLPVYASLSLTVGLPHTDQVYVLGSGDKSVQPTVVNHSGRAVGNDFCFACVFTSAQRVQSHTPVLHLSMCQTIASRIVPLRLETVPQPESARAPPLASIS